MISVILKNLISDKNSRIIVRTTIFLKEYINKVRNDENVLYKINIKKFISRFRIALARELMIPIYIKIIDKQVICKYNNEKVEIIWKSVNILILQ